MFWQKKIGKVSGHEEVKTWSTLLEKTGANSTGTDFWLYADDWQKPAAMPKPDTTSFMTINFWRTPQGDKEVSVAEVQSAKFIPGKSKTVSGAAMTNEQYFTAEDNNGKVTYDPKEFHTYTMVWTPKELSYYVDAPEGGKKIEEATPVKTFKFDDYPGLEMTDYSLIFGFAGTYMPTGFGGNIGKEKIFKITEIK